MSSSSPAFLQVSVLVSFVSWPFLSSFFISDLLWYCCFIHFFSSTVWKHCYQHYRQQKRFWLCIQIGDKSTVATEANYLIQSSAFCSIHFCFTAVVPCPRPRSHSSCSVEQIVWEKLGNRRCGRNDEYRGEAEYIYLQPWLVMERRKHILLLMNVGTFKEAKTKKFMVLSCSWINGIMLLLSRLNAKYVFA